MLWMLLDTIKRVLGHIPGGFWTGFLQVLAFSLLESCLQDGPAQCGCAFSGQQLLVLCFRRQKSCGAFKRWTGLYWCYGISLGDSTDITWFGVLIFLQLISFHCFLNDFWPFLSYAWSYNKLLISLLATVVIQLPCWMRNKGTAP